MADKRYRVNVDNDGHITRIHVEDRQPHKESRGHSQHRSGAGFHDERPRRERTRGDVIRKAMERDDG